MPAMVIKDFIQKRGKHKRKDRHINNEYAL
jgi:hypothetical protein